MKRQILIPSTLVFITTLVVFVSYSIFFAIDTREVGFANGSINLKGTLYLPKGDGPFPAVVFVHGSGAETRNNSRYSAKWLASIGYVVLTYDKRGSGESDGEEKALRWFSIEDLGNDVLAAVNLLSEQKEVDKDKIGLHAASQGGWVAPYAAAKSDMISFMIIKSASVCSIGEDRVFERSTRLREEGFSDEDIKEAVEMQRVEAKTTPAIDLSDQFTKLFDQYKSKPWFSRVYGGTDPFSKTLVDIRKWYATIVDVNSINYLEKIDIPIFWIFGDPKLDHSAPVATSLEALNKLKQSGKSYEIMFYEGQGHNVKEKKYELSLYNWLLVTNKTDGFNFKKH